MLKFMQLYEYYGGYSHRNKFKSAKDPLFLLRRFVAIQSPANLYVTTKVRFRQWIPVVDCDSEFTKGQAVEFLKEEGYRYVSIRSSEGRSWILLDELMPYKEALKLMSVVPGQDRLYVGACSSHPYILLRAVPKLCFIPSIEEIHSELYNIKSWVDSFMAWWGCNDMSRVQIYKGNIMMIEGFSKLAPIIRAKDLEIK